MSIPATLPPCCCRSLAEDVLGRLSCLERCTLCGQMMQTMDSARAMLALGRMLPSLEVG